MCHAQLLRRCFWQQHLWLFRLESSVRSRIIVQMFTLTGPPPSPPLLSVQLPGSFTEADKQLPPIFTPRPLLPPLADVQLPGSFTEEDKQFHLQLEEVVRKAAGGSVAAPDGGMSEDVQPPVSVDARQLPADAEAGVNVPPAAGGGW